LAARRESGAMDAAQHGRTVLDIIQDWFGEPLSRPLLKRCGSLTPNQVTQYVAYLQSSVRDVEVPPCALGQSRPFATTSTGVKAHLLLADDVAVPNVAMPRPLNTDIDDVDEPSEFLNPEYLSDRSHVSDIQTGLAQLLRLKPLLDAGRVRVLPFSLDVYRRRAIERIRVDPALYALACAFFPESEREGILMLRQRSLREARQSWSDHEATGWIRFAMGFPIGPAALLFTLADAVAALEIESRHALDVQVSSSWAELLSLLAVLAKEMPAYWEDMTGDRRDAILVEFFAKVSQSASPESPAEHDLVTILGSMSVPRLDALSFNDLAHLHASSDELAKFRSALRSGLAQAESSWGHPGWVDRTRGILRDELVVARSDLIREIEKSSFLRQSITGARSVVVSAVGAAGVAVAGGSVEQALIASGFSASASTFLGMIDGLRSRRRNRPLLAHYLLFEEAPDLPTLNTHSETEPYWRVPWLR
jgi:hypothetical protein